MNYFFYVGCNTGDTLDKIAGEKAGIFKVAITLVYLNFKWINPFL